MASKTSAHPSELALYHRNPNIGDVPAIEASLLAHDQYRPVVVNKGTHTGRPMEVLAGNHTVTAIRNLAERYPADRRWHKVLIHVVDVDDDRARRIVLADNRTAELSDTDNTVLVELLEALHGDLDGTGYDLADLDALTAVTAGPPDLDDLHTEVGDPQPDDYNKTVRLAVTVEVLRAWLEHRRGFTTDTDALAALLNAEK